MTYEQTLDYLYNLLPMYQRNGKAAIKKDLTNIRELCFKLGYPQWQFNSIHIGGTNGKGSVSAMLTSILKEAGYKTGMYTSPHLKEFTERIRIHGKELKQKSVVQFVENHRSIIEEVNPSFFELTVAMAFHAFAEEQVDLAVIEVGLGGRLDSTNIITPELSVITNISYDHQDLLGDTLEAIAAEKAGIIKKYTPVVVGEMCEETKHVFIEQADSLKAPITFASESVKIVRKERQLQWQVYEVEGELEGLEGVYKLDLAGDYQAKNLATCICAVNQLIEDGWNISPQAVKNGLKKVIRNTGFLGRMQLLSENPRVICDTGHNEAGVTAVFEQLADISYDQLHIVWGMVNDKEHGKILNLLPKDATYYFAQPNVPRGLDTSKLAGIAKAFDLKGKSYDSVELALTQAKQDAKVNDLIFVGGSTFVVAEVV